MAKQTATPRPTAPPDDQPTVDERSVALLQEALAEEDSRIASDLGDTVIRSMFGTGLRLQSLLPRVDEDVREEILQVIAGIDEAIRELRDVIFGLRGGNGDRIDLDD